MGLLETFLIMTYCTRFVLCWTWWDSSAESYKPGQNQISFKGRVSNIQYLPWFTTKLFFKFSLAHDLVIEFILGYNRKKSWCLFYTPSKIDLHFSNFTKNWTLVTWGLRKLGCHNIPNFDFVSLLKIILHLSNFKNSDLTSGGWGCHDILNFSFVPLLKITVLVKFLKFWSLSCGDGSGACATTFKTSSLYPFWKKFCPCQILVFGTWEVRGATVLWASISCLFWK